VRVLVVDSHADTGELFAVVLEGAGAKVRVASRADDALLEASSWCPNVVVSDLAIPGQDGWSFVRDLHALKGFEHVAAVAVTGWALERAREGALAAGFSDFADKPLMPDALVTLVERWAPLLSSGETPAP
jgi:CheY-like chemotaxis protein